MEQFELTRRSLLAAIGATAITACVPRPALGSGPTLTLDEVIRRNTLARGGAALDAVRSMAGEVEIDEGGQKLNGRYAASVEGLTRIDVYVGGQSVFSEGIDEDGGWFWDGKEIKLSNAGGVAALRNGAENHLFGWHRFAGRGHKLALMSPATIDGTAYHVVEIRYGTGHTTYFYVDPASWLAVRKRDERAYHPDVDMTKQKVESRFSDFRAVEGVVASHRDEDYDLSTGKLLAAHRLLRRDINPPLAAGHFDRNRRAPAAW